MQSALTAGAVLRSSALASASDRVRVACIGVRGRGTVHIERYARMPNVEVAALCDVDRSVLDHALQSVEKASGRRPAGYTDFRKLLEDRSIDAVSIATPNHWHSLQAIWACQAGKDVYVEKPCSHTVFEARQVVAAARRANRIVQHGTQSRSTAGVREAAEKLRAGVIGDVYMARGLCYKWRETIGHTPEGPVPEGVDYNLWLGPAPQRPFSRNRFHYNWHWFWDYGDGDIGNQGVHQIDTGRWLLGVRYPTRISAIGGHFLFDDDQETPNTLTATFEFRTGGKPRLFVFDVRHWMTNHEGGIGEPLPGGVAQQVDLKGQRVAGAVQNTIGNLFYGSEGYMVVADGYQTYLGKTREPGPASSVADEDHFENFIQAVRSRKASELTADIEEGAISTTLIHLANISYRLGRTLQFDPDTLTCKGDAEANAMLTRTYRAPFVVPAIV
jgi:predicted dehydrogenase